MINYAKVEQAVGTWEALSVDTAKDVIILLREFTNEYGWEVQYSFAHIVLDDWNLSDSDIDFCLSLMHIWVSEQLDMCPKEAIDRTSSQLWERWCYDLVMKQKDAIVGLLNKLKSVPEDIRAEASALLWGD